MKMQTPILKFVQMDKLEAICPFNSFKIWGHSSDEIYVG